MENLEKMKGFPNLEPKKGEEMLAFVFVWFGMHESNSLKSTDPAFEHSTIYTKEIEVNRLPIVCIEVITVGWGTMTMVQGVGALEAIEYLQSLFEMI